MTQTKFDETDRRAAIGALSRHLGVRLRPVGRRRKWLRDDSDRSYWILGGYGEWHGVPEEMMDAEVTRSSGGSIVIALRHQSAIKLFIAALAPLVEAREKLYRASHTTGDYQFTCKERGGHLVIEQAPEVRLSELATISFDEARKASVAHVKHVERLLANMSEKERSELLKKLQDEDEV